MTETTPPSAAERMARRVAEAQMLHDLGLLPHPSTTLFRSKLAQRSTPTPKPTRPKIRYRIKPTRAPRRPSPLPSARAVVATVQGSIMQDQVAARFSMTRNKVMRACRLGLLPWPIRHDGRPASDRRWSLIALAVFDYWQMSKRRTAPRRKLWERWTAFYGTLSGAEIVKLSDHQRSSVTRSTA
jgi:hypothetical protein